MVADVARRLGVRAGTLSWWLWKLRREAPKPGRQRRTEFLPVVIAQPVRSAPAVLELEASGVRLRVEAGTDVRYVVELVAAIRATC
jgi:transposase-like protein